MSNYIIGVFLSIIVILFHSCSNIFDNYLSTKIFTRLSNLIFFSGLINLLFLPFCLLFGVPHLVTIQSFGIIFLISLINVFYQYPYYWALKKTDTSIVISLFSLAKIFTPLFAFFFLGEHLKNVQYIGFFLIILTSILLTFDLKKLQFNTSAFLMFFVSIALTIQVILYKILFDKAVSWSSALLWIGLFDFLISIPFVFLPKNLINLKDSFRNLKRVGRLFLLNQFLSWGGEAISMFALFFIPVSVFEGITSTQPIFVLMFAFLFVSKFPSIFTEYLKDGILKKKIIFYIIMAIGTVLIVV